MLKCFVESMDAVSIFKSACWNVKGGSSTGAPLDACMSASYTEFCFWKIIFTLLHWRIVSLNIENKDKMKKIQTKNKFRDICRSFLYKNV